MKIGIIMDCWLQQMLSNVIHCYDIKQKKVYCNITCVPIFFNIGVIKKDIKPVNSFPFIVSSMLQLSWSRVNDCKTGSWKAHQWQYHGCKTNRKIRWKFCSKLVPLSMLTLVSLQKGVYYICIAILVILHIMMSVSSSIINYPEILNKVHNWIKSDFTQEYLYRKK